jgi:hypothetical protein
VQRIEREIENSSTRGKKSEPKVSTKKRVRGKSKEEEAEQE